MSVLNLRKKPLVLLLCSAFAGQVGAQETATVQKIEVTGSSIKRIDVEGILPVTVVKAEEFIRKGMTSVEEVMGSLSMNMQSTTSSGNVGLEMGGKSSANLRGLGDGRTLVLLNGRRLANHPYDGASVDLNAIPLSALDRVEVLRDGASHIYGTDAVAGVINFITKRSVTGTSISVETNIPQQTGGKEKRLNVSSGFGDLAKDGYNVFVVADTHEQARIRATDRTFSSTGILPAYGINKTSGTTFPANFFSAAGITGNPGFAKGCDAPFSIPRAGDGGSNKGTCRQDYARYVDGIPATAQNTLFAKSIHALGGEHFLSFELLHAASLNKNSIAPPPMTGLKMNSTSPWYPGGSGGVPAVAGLSGEDLNVSWRTTEGGRREATNRGKMDQFVVNLNGEVAGWSYRTGLNAAQMTVTEDLTDGYLIDQVIHSGVLNGKLNPFGIQDATGRSLLASAQLRGRVVNAQAKNLGVDGRLTKEFSSWNALPIGFAIGIEARKEESEFTLDRHTLDQMMISRASGLVNAKNNFGDRHLSAMYTELSIPATTALELQAAARYDKYSDAGSTFNPKLGFRYQPGKQWLLRGSANSGFRAPTLYELNGPVVDGITSRQFDDPLLCPNGVAKPGVNPNISCGMNLPTRFGGNPDLKPEKSKSYSLGFLVEPMTGFTTSLDYSKILISQTIGLNLVEDEILADPVKYASRFHYNASGTALDYINVASLNNSGERMTRALDLTLQWRPPQTSLGWFDFWFNGTYVLRDTFQNTDDSPVQENIALYNGATRWRHNASARLSSGAWSGTLSQRYSSSYLDQNQVAEAFRREVAAYSIWTFSLNYTGWKNLNLSMGVKNLLNTDPPFSNQAPNPQSGYDPRFADPIGRSFYMRATYKFR
ncbi:MAG: TonB-dependent receptor [Burkholderiales bacterium]|nr:TonB-dependent receptor [Burkholderiales bacterium]